jgi:hypothetical protein
LAILRDALKDFPYLKYILPGPLCEVMGKSSLDIQDPSQYPAKISLSVSVDEEA